MSDEEDGCESCGKCGQQPHKELSREELIDLTKKMIQERKQKTKYYII